MTLEDLGELSAELWSPSNLSAAGIGPDAERFDAVVSDLGITTDTAEALT